MGIPISDTDYQIARTSALKAAAALASSITYANPNDVLAVAQTFEDWLLGPFTKPTGQPSNVPPPSSGFSSPAPQNLPDPYSPTTSGTVTSQPIPPSAQICPACLEAGRQGVVVTKVSKKGNQYRQCSLRKAAQKNGEWIDVGPCSWVDYD